MRIDLVMIIMLLSWIGLGYTGSELIQATEELNVCRAEAGTRQSDLLTCQAEKETLKADANTCRNRVTEAEGQLGTCQTSLDGKQADVIRLEGALDACELDNDWKQDQLETMWNGNFSGATNGALPEKSAPASGWLETLAAFLAAGGFTVSKILSVRKGAGNLPNDAMRVTEMERQLIVNLRRKTRR